MKLFWLVLVLLVTPILPILLLGAPWQQQLTDSVAGLSDDGGALTALVVGGLLALDIFLPTPSGPLATLAGARLGFFPAVMVVWCGLVSGASAGFALAKRWGRPIAERLAGGDVLRQLEQVFNDRATSMLLVTRPLPILAEAAVLLAGVAGVPWRRFLPPTVSGSLLFAAALAAVGRYAADNEMLTIAVTLSAVLPILAAVGIRQHWRSKQNEH